MQNYENEMQGLMNYMGPDYLNMVGGDEPANGLIGYKGIQNPFEKNSRLSKIVAASNGREFDITVVNAELDTQEFYLTPSMLVTESDNGHPLSGKAISGKELAFSSSSGPSAAGALKAFYRFIADNPSLILGIRIASSTATQMNKTIIVTTNINPFFAQYAAKKLNIQSYVDENNQQRDIATIDQLLPADQQSQIKVPVVKGTHTFTLFIGPGANMAQMLRGQANEQTR